MILVYLNITIAELKEEDMPMIKNLLILKKIILWKH